MNGHLFKWGLFVFWPFIGLLLLVSVALVVAGAWLLIPLGSPSQEGGTWSIKFPWSGK